MCGIAGVINARLTHGELEALLCGLEGALQHRGPDDQGHFISPDGAAGLVNTRLAILDLSPAGHQPMTSRDGRYTIVFNGEIYNYAALRAQITDNGEPLTSRSDTEVLLELFRREGPRCLERLDGMFAIAIWDDQESSLFLARDPLGIKPLYYHESGERIVFASELRPLINSGLIPRQLSQLALTGYLLTGSVPEPCTLIQDVLMLPAGHYLVAKGGVSTRSQFWDVRFAENAMTPDEAVAATRSALQDSVARHHVSDVPVGVFLSGGIDSTAILALSSQMAKRDLRTFSISFDQAKFDEGGVAERTAQHFGARHTDWRLDSGTARALLGRFMECSDQPSVDGFNTFCVSKLAHEEGLKVVLSGLGGDEVFGGYQSFRMVPRMMRGSARFDGAGPLRRLAGKALEAGAGSPRLSRLGNFLRGEPTAERAYGAMRGIFTLDEVNRLLPRYFGSGSPPEAATAATIPSQPTLEDEVSYLEITRYMRNQLLPIAMS